VGQRLTAASHGMVGYAAINSATLGDALELVTRYASLRTSLISIEKLEGPREVRLVISEPVPLGEIQRPFLEATVLSLCSILGTISMGALPIVVSFPFAEPDYAPLARDMLRCEVLYGQSWAGLSAPPEMRDLPIKLADQHAFAEADRICQLELEKLVANTSLSARVRRLFLEQQNGFPSLAATARTLHMTQRTLHRRLLDEGTSYRELLEEVRHTLALEHLKSGRFSFAEIAYVLGYTDLANFRRAFRRWEQQPPSAYKAGLAEPRKRARR
jgi:AraC-like DNA-binding protein